MGGLSEVDFPTCYRLVSGGVKKGPDAKTRQR